MPEQTDPHTLTVTQDGFVTSVTFSRPPHNHVSTQLLADLADTLEKLDQDDSCRAIVLRSEGRIFCAGADLSDKGADTILEGGGAEGTTQSHLYREAVRLFSTRKPVIVAVQGAAVGAGLGISLIGDFRIAAPEARFVANFSKLGLHPGFGISAVLPKVIGQQNASLMLLTGRRVKPEEAADMGLVDRITATETLYEEATALAAEIAANAPLAVMDTRATLRAGLADLVRQQTDIEWALQKKHQQTEDYREGIRAVSERRPGNFKAR